jgi:hypothetical protein
LAAQFQDALERASADVDTASPPAEEFAVCPSCSSVLVRGEYGCPRCGYGRKSFFAKHKAIIVVGAICLVIGALLILFLVFGGTR